MPLLSAGIALWRRRSGQAEILLAHFGGPQWQKKDRGAWGIPKGLVEPGEAPEACARREFQEELGTSVTGEVQTLGRVRQAGGKWVEAFALEGDLDPEKIVSNHFTLVWPPRSGKVRSFPEVDRARWFGLAEADDWILPSQRPILERLGEWIEGNGRRPE